MNVGENNSDGILTLWRQSYRIVPIYIVMSIRNKCREQWLEIWIHLHIPVPQTIESNYNASVIMIVELLLHKRIRIRHSGLTCEQKEYYFALEEIHFSYVN